MTDRELLEAAAKAAGIDLQPDAYSNLLWVREKPEDISGLVWNPLLDDGDAFRLAVRLGIGLAKPDNKFPNVRRAFLSDIRLFTVTDADACAATRRAIVRAAAAMGVRND